MTQIRMRGKKLELSISSEGLKPGERILGVDGIDAKALVQTGRLARGEDEKVALEVDDGDVLELRSKDGRVQLMSVEEARKKSPTRARDDGSFDLPTLLSGPVARGASNNVIDQIMQFDVSKIQKKVTGALAGQAADLTAEAIVYIVEKEPWNQSRPCDLGLKRLREGYDHFELEDFLAPETAPEEPYLVLIHGTFSNATSGFKGFVGTDEWKQLTQRYAGRVLAFEHKTLGESPIENALALARALPGGAKLHLITHSRGGLVGDLLNVGNISENDLTRMVRMREKRKPKQSLAELFREGVLESALDEAEDLRALCSELRAKGIQVERYLRAASPSRGTVLASSNLDKSLELILNVVGLTPGLEANPIYGFVKALALATVGKRSDPRALPGLEAMMPDSPFQWLLNRQDVHSDDHLGVIAGDIQGSGLLGKLKVAAADAFLFGWVDHDLVVNTSSMYQGVRRTSALASFQQGPEISHMTYFSNTVARARMLNYFTHSHDEMSPPPRGFVELRPGTSDLAADNTTRAARAARAAEPTTQPVLVVVGAQLAVSPGTDANADNEVLDWSIGSKGLVKALEQDWPELSGEIYTGLLNYLGGHFHVLRVPYELGKTPAQMGNKVAECVRHAQEKGSGAVSILAHSGGALAVVALIGGASGIVDELRRHDGHIVLLGPPLFGSHEAARWVSGEGALVEELEMLDPLSSAAELGEVLESQDGIQALLPPDGERSTSLRSEITAALEKGLLGGVHCVFGTASDTLVPARGRETDDAKWESSPHGDGFILHRRASDLGGATSWVASADHAGLAREPSLFPALLELLAKGTTTRLSTGPTEVEETQQPLPAPTQQLFPTAQSLMLAALGSPEGQVLAPEGTVLEIGVVNGSIEKMSCPVAVGHYTGSLIKGAEGFLDWRLDGELRDRQYLGLYPEVPGSSELIAPNGPKKLAALVLGLGLDGELSPGRLTTAVADGAKRYALAAYSAAKNSDDDEAERPEVELASVLIGTIGRQGLSMPTAIAAIVRGVLQANRSLAEQGSESGSRPQISKLTFIERYEDLAEEAAVAVRDIEKLLRSELDITVRLRPAAYLREEEGSRPGRPQQDYEEGAWQPFIIDSKLPCEYCQGPCVHCEQSKTDRDAGREPDRELEYSFLGRRARATSSDGLAMTDQMRRLIEETVSKPDFGQINNTLYELMIPHELKQDVANAGNLLLVVDPHSATIPWELMALRDRRHELVPLSTSMGVLRRLKLDNYRFEVRPPMDQHALVIGDPSGGERFPRLKGAREEAKCVAEQLSQAGYEVNASLIAKDEKDTLDWVCIMNAAFEFGYRILHIAGHGVYDPDSPEKSGVVIGDGSYLTAKMIGSMPIVPELVFINCCHLGSTSTAAEPSDAGGKSQDDPLPRTHRNLNALAASVAAELIKIGVRAVVAAGWAVDDIGAQKFAEVFYEDMLGGFAFGDAVRRAREAAYEAAKDSNTWGAYQCYGEPSFRLDRPRADAEMTREPAVSRVSFERRIEYLIDSVGIARSDERVREWGPRLRELEQQAPPQWLAHANTLYLLGRAYSEVGDYKESIGHYKRAFEADKAVWPAELVEQLANIEVRYATALHRGVAEDENPESTGETIDALMDDAEDPIVALMNDAKGRLDLMIELHATPERLALLGSYHRKRATTLEDPQEVREALKEARDAYKEAGVSRGKRGYQANNYLLLRALVKRDLDVDDDRNVVVDLLADAREKAKSPVEKSEDFWDRVAPADAALTALLWTPDGELDEQGLAAGYRDLVDAYKAAFSTRSTVRERNSPLELMADLERLCEGSDLDRADEHRTGLQSVLEAFKQEHSGSLS